MIQDNVDMIVTDGDFNDASVRRVLDTKFSSIMKKQTATNFMFRDKAKFDIQNPVLGTIYNQLLTKKQKEREELENINKVSSIKDLDIWKRLDALGKFNLGVKDNNNDDDDDNDDDNDGNSSYHSCLSFQPTSHNLPPTLPVTTSTSTLSPTQKFLLDDGNEKPTQAIALDRTSTPVTKRITFSDAITKIFPKTRKLKTIDESLILEGSDNQNIEDENESDISSVIEELKDGNLPVDLEFFYGGKKN